MRLAFPTYVPRRRALLFFKLTSLYAPSAFSPNSPFDEERDQVFEKHIAALQNLSLTHHIFGLPQAFQQLPFHLAIKGATLPATPTILMTTDRYISLQS